MVLNKQIDIISHHITIVISLIISIQKNKNIYIYINMFEISANQINLNYSETSVGSDLLTLRNTNQGTSYAYKIKTTNPELFEVMPSKGVLHSGQIKKVEFKTKRGLRIEEVNTLHNKEKFLIQYIKVSDKKKPQEIEQQWAQYKKDSTHIDSIKLKVNFIGFAHNSSLKVNQPEAPFRSIIKQVPVQNQVLTADLSDLADKLDRLKQREIKLEQERKEIYQTIVSNEKKKQAKSGGGSRLIILLICFVLGLVTKKNVYDKYIAAPKKIPPKEPSQVKIQQKSEV